MKIPPYAVVIFLICVISVALPYTCGCGGEVSDPAPAVITSEAPHYHSGPKPPEHSMCRSINQTTGGCCLWDASPDATECQ